MAANAESYGVDIREPYVGPRPFEEGDEDIFFGRDQETNELVSLIIAHSIVLLYSQSGAGKTSLLRASLIPALKKRKLEVFPLARVRGPDGQFAQVSDDVNIYVQNAVRYFSASGVKSNRSAKISLADFFRPRTPSNRREVLPLRIVFFDQVEELFTLYPERFEDRKNFFEQIQAVLNADPILRMVFAMREDFIAELDPYAHILPEKLQTRYRLMRLNEHSARIAIERPLERANRSRSIKYMFDSEAADKIVDNLRTVYLKISNGGRQVHGPFIEPVHLQVVCQAIWRRLQSSFPEGGGTDITEFKITRNHIDEFGDVNDALLHFYDETLKKAVEVANKQSSPKSPKITEGALRSWFGRTLITPENTRGTIFSGRKDETVSGIPKAAIQELESQRLIRAELRGGEIWYELSHDRFIQPIRDSNEAWLHKQPFAQRKGLELESKAAKWWPSKNRDLLMNQPELQDAKHWMESPEAAGIGFSDILFAFVQASQAMQQQRRVRKLMIGSAILGGALVVTAASTIYAYWQRAVALDAERRAVMSAHVAQEQQQRAEDAQRQAVMSAKAAQEQQQRAEDSARGAAIERELAKKSEQEAIAAERRAQANLVEAQRLSKQVALGYQSGGTAFSPDGKFLVTVDREGTRLFDVVTGKELARLDEGGTSVAVFDPSGRLIATGNRDGRVRLWSRDGKLQASLLGHTATVRRIAFSPDARSLGTASDDGTARIWNVASGKQIGETLRSTVPVLDVFFSPDGKTVLSTSADGTTRIWDLTGRPLREFR